MDGGLYLLFQLIFLYHQQLVETRDIKSLTNLDIFETAYEVEMSLQRHDVSKCLAWCHENKSKLKINLSRKKYKPFQFCD